MSKPVMLSDDAYAVLKSQKRPNRGAKKDTLSAVVLRFVPPPIKTFGDLEKHLENIEGPIAVDWDALQRLKNRKKKARRAR